MTRYLANIITSLRLAMAFPLALIEPFSHAWYVVLLLCAGTDMVDGAIARSFGTSTRIGALLDSIADAAICLVIARSLWISGHLNTTMILWIGMILGIALLAVAIGYRRFRTMALAHTVPMKAVGVGMYLVPLSLVAMSVGWMMYPLLAIGTYAVCEEVAIVLQEPAFDPDHRGYLWQESPPISDVHPSRVQHDGWTPS